MRSFKTKPKTGQMRSLPYLSRVLKERSIRVLAPFHVPNVKLVIPATCNNLWQFIGKCYELWGIGIDLLHKCFALVKATVRSNLSKIFCQSQKLLINLIVTKSSDSPSI
ncbi:hypothetical protein [Coleofasciculus sp. H7-2]|uniref:hypothetical protein n=1 Tax=Coleofasciculus sp. H7-2 TaxID=3351545 RepID=UPI00366B210E